MSSRQNQSDWSGAVLGAAVLTCIVFNLRPHSFATCRLRLSTALHRLPVAFQADPKHNRYIDLYPTCYRLVRMDLPLDLAAFITKALSMTIQRFISNVNGCG